MSLDDITNKIEHATGIDSENLFLKHYNYNDEARVFKYLFIGYAYHNGYEMKQLADYLNFKSPVPLYKYRNRHWERMRESTAYKKYYKKLTNLKH